MSVGCVADNDDALVLVDLVFFIDWRILPFAIYLLSGRYFWISSTVSPGQVAKKIALDCSDTCTLWGAKTVLMEGNCEVFFGLTFVD